MMCPFPLYEPGIRLAAPAVSVWGRRSKRHATSPRFSKGKSSPGSSLPKRGAGSDLAGLQTTTIRDGDEFVINGEKIFVGGLHDVDQFWLLGKTDQKPAAQDLGCSSFRDLPGVQIELLDLIAAGARAGFPGQKNVVAFKDVRVSAACLIGQETSGWGVANSTLEIEHGGSGGLFTHRVADKFITCCRTDPGMVKRLKENPELADAAVKVYIDAQIDGSWPCEITGSGTPRESGRTRETSTPITGRCSA